MSPGFQSRLIEACNVPVRGKPKGESLLPAQNIGAFKRLQLSTLWMSLTLPSTAANLEVTTDDPRSFALSGDLNEFNIF